MFAQKDGTVKLLTPPDPKTGRESRTFDALDWVHAITTQIPDPGQHMVRCDGAYSNRALRLHRAQEEEGESLPASGPTEDEEDEDALVKARRRSWARLLRRIYEVDPLTCPRCGSELKIVAVITDPAVVSQTLSERSESKGTASWITAGAGGFAVRSTRALRRRSEEGLVMAGEERGARASWGRCVLLGRWGASRGPNSMKSRSTINRKSEGRSRSRAAN